MARLAGHDPEAAVEPGLRELDDARPPLVDCQIGHGHVDLAAAGGLDQVADGLVLPVDEGDIEPVGERLPEFDRHAAEMVALLDDEGRVDVNADGDRLRGDGRNGRDFLRPCPAERPALARMPEPAMPGGRRRNIMAAIMARLPSRIAAVMVQPFRETPRRTPQATWHDSRAGSRAALHPIVRSSTPSQFSVPSLASSASS